MAEPAKKDDDIIEGEVVEEKPTDLVPVSRTASALDVPVADFQAALDRRKANRDALMKWVKAALKEGTDYGKIHVVKKAKCQYAARYEKCPIPGHYSKDCLFKPGAEKICGMLGVTPIFPNLREYEKAAVNGQPIENIILRCELQNSQGVILGEGVGARSVEKDYGDINKALKMAEKSAQIDATLKMAGLSEIFTQDLDDTPPREDPKPQPKPNPQQKADQETKAQAWTDSIWKTLEGSGHPDPRGAWKQAAKDAGLKGSVGATQAQQKKFKECVLSLIDDWRSSLDPASEEAVNHDTGPIDDMPPGPAEDYATTQKVSGDHVDHLIETAKASCDFIKDSRGVLEWARGQLKKFDLKSLEDLTIDEYEGLLNVLDHKMGDSRYDPQRGLPLDGE